MRESQHCILDKKPNFTEELYMCLLIIPHHKIVVGCYGFTLDIRVCLFVCPSVHQLYIRLSVFLFRMITSKHQWIFTKLGMCIDIMEIWFVIANGQISSNVYGVI